MGLSCVCVQQSAPPALPRSPAPHGPLQTLTKACSSVQPACSSVQQRLSRRAHREAHPGAAALAQHPQPQAAAARSSLLAASQGPRPPTGASACTGMRPSAPGQQGARRCARLLLAAARSVKTSPTVAQLALCKPVHTLLTAKHACKRQLRRAIAAKGAAPGPASAKPRTLRHA